jgi:hypothetical protein
VLASILLHGAEWIGCRINVKLVVTTTWESSHPGRLKHPYMLMYVVEATISNRDPGEFAGKRGS